MQQTACSFLCNLNCSKSWQLLVNKSLRATSPLIGCKRISWTLRVLSGRGQQRSSTCLAVQAVQAALVQTSFLVRTLRVRPPPRRRGARPENRRTSERMSDILCCPCQEVPRAITNLDAATVPYAVMRHACTTMCVPRRQCTSLKSVSLVRNELRNQTRSVSRATKPPPL